MFSVTRRVQCMSAASGTEAATPEIGGFRQVEVPTEQVDAVEATYAPLVDAIRRLTDVVVRARAGADDVADAVKQLESLITTFEADAEPGPAGIQFNSEGRSWNWGNAALGQRNAVAPPLRLEFVGESSRMVGEADLGAAYEGPPGMVHGGVSALLLDHLMGETASNRHTQLTFTGTLTLRYRSPLPLGPVRLESWIDRQEGRKVFVRATIGTTEQVAIEGEGIFVIPRWALPEELVAGI